MEWTNVKTGLMTDEEIGKEVRNYLNSCKKPSKLLVTIERKENEKFYMKFYISIKDSKKKMCGKCEVCLSILSDIFVY